MSYPKDLDEYSEEDLDAELKRRADLRLKGLCDYCGRHRDMPTCRMPKRHEQALDTGQVRFPSDDWRP